MSTELINRAVELEENALSVRSDVKGLRKMALSVWLKCDALDSFETTVLLLSSTMNWCWIGRVYVTSVANFQRITGGASYTSIMSMAPRSYVGYYASPATSESVC